MLESLHSVHERRCWWLVFVSGVALSLVMAWRAQVGGDQRLLLELGWSLVAQGDWLPYGMPTSAGGRSPGGLMGLLMAIPLWIWRDYRAPALFTALLHAAAFLLLVVTLCRVLTRHGLWLLLLLVWLNPWRMYFSAHIWNANLMFVMAVLHLAGAQRMAQHREAWNSALQVLLIALAMQIHTSAAVLAVLSLLLLWKRLIQVHWGGFVIGVGLSIASYLPWLLAIHAQPTLTPGDKGFFLRGLLYVFPFIRGVLYWLKMASLTMASRMMELDFTSMLDARVSSVLVMLGVVLGALAYLTLLPSAWAHYRFVRRMWSFVTQPRSVTTARAWLRGYMALMLLAALISFAISPTTVMFWQVFISLPVAALVLIMAAQVLLRSRWRQPSMTVVRLWSGATVLMLLLQTLGAPLYRCGGRYVGNADAMLLALHVPMACSNPNANYQ